MKSFLEVLGFEMRQQCRSPMFAGLAIVFFVIHMLTLSQAGINLSDNQQIDINSVYLIFRTELVLNVFGMAPAIFFVVNAASRDQALGTAEFFYTTPTPRLSFLLGRFTGAALCTLLVGLAGVLGAMAGTIAPWADAERIGPFALEPYWLAFVFIAAPNLIIFSAFAFCAAALTRGPLLSFGLALAFVVSATVLDDWAVMHGAEWMALLDPFGGVPIEQVVRFWTVEELNRVPPIALLPANRMVWLGLAAVALGATFLRFRMQYAPSGEGKRGRGPAPANAVAAVRPVAGRFGVTGGLAQFASQWRMDLRGVLLSPLFWLVIAFTVASTVNEVSSDVSAMGNLPKYPLTSGMLGFLRYGLIQFVALVIIFYSGILLHRERDHRLHEVVGAAPYQDWLPLASKILTLCAVLMLVLLASVLTCIAWQAMAGHSDFELGVYLLGVFVFNGFHFCMLAVLACLLQVLAPGKWSGMALVTAAMIVLASLGPVGLEHLLYGFRIPYVAYSDMNGFGHYRAPAYSLMAYWGAFCVLLILAGHLLFPRGTLTGFKARMAEARRRFTPAAGAIALMASVAFLSAGGWIFYNTNVLNDYETAASRLQLKADYERKYAAYKELPPPSAVDIDLSVDVYPRERRLQSSGRAILRNTQAAPLSRVFITSDPKLSFEALAIEGGVMTSQDRKLGVFLFDLKTPLAPGAETVMSWKASRHARGFVNSEPDNQLVANGTSLPLSSVMPRIAYDSEREAESGVERKRAGLPPAPRLPKLGDPAWINRLGYGVANPAAFHLVFSTDADQIAVAPGVLKRQWTQGGRRYFDYRMEFETRPVMTLASARYQVARDRWNGVDIEVYHHARHPWNVKGMLDTSKLALEYFDREFAPYPLSFFRIVEFPGYRDQAQAFAGTITYSETVGFTNDLRGVGPLDYTTIHELAHQWWGGMAYGARMQGRQVLNEGLAQYSTFMMFKHHSDAKTLHRILADTHNSYLNSRSEESIAEMPVLLSEDQGNISYGKAPLAMFALQELIGEAKVNQALRAYLQRFGMKPAPYPTSRDLVNELRAVAGPEHQALITDLFEKIMLYDVKVTKAEVRRVGDEYEVVMDINARQFQADSQGKETEVPLDAPFPVVVFPQSPKDLMELTPLYKAHHRLRTGVQRLVVRVPSAPGSAAVDPYHLMIDRIRDDNTFTLGLQAKR